MSMRYGSYDKPFPLGKIPVLRTKSYGGKAFRMPFFPKPFSMANDHTTRAQRFGTDKKRRTYAATGQWFGIREGGSARQSNAFTQFNGMGADAATCAPCESAPSRLMWTAIGAALVVGGTHLLGKLGGRKR